MNKIERVKPLIKAKQADFDKEIRELSKIKEQKILAIGDLRKTQQKYMDGANQVNYEREQGNHQAAKTLEPSLTFVKTQWHDSLKNVQDLEKKQEVQLSRVLHAQQELKSFEALEEKYVMQLEKLKRLAEQKELDELSVSSKSRSVS